MAEVIVVSLTLAALVVLSQVAPPVPPKAPAPPARSPVSLTVSVGHGQTWEDEGSIGSGTAAGGGMEWRFSPRWWLGADVERLGYHRDTPGLEWSGRTVLASVNLDYRFAARGVSPYISGGFGGAFQRGETIDRIAPAAVSRPRTSASTMKYGAMGVQIPIGDRWTVSPDFRITFCNPPVDFAPSATMRFAVKAAFRL
jgi:hypothetical protein